MAMVKYTDKTLMPFGKYKGTALANVPAQYLLWLHGEGTSSPPLMEYLNDSLEALKQEVKRSTKFNAR